MKAIFIMEGISLPRTASVRHENTDKESAKCIIDMPDDRIKALFNLFKNNEGSWDSKPRVLVEYIDATPSGLPINGKLIEILEL